MPYTSLVSINKFKIKLCKILCKHSAGVLHKKKVKKNKTIMTIKYFKQRFGFKIEKLHFKNYKYCLKNIFFKTLSYLAKTNTHINCKFFSNWKGKTLSRSIFSIIIIV